MTLTGNYTQAGAQLQTAILAGEHTLTITRAVAAIGPTPDDGQTLVGEKQELSIVGINHDGPTSSVEVSLVASLAAKSYTMSEIGLYARRQDGGDVLYRIYRLSEAVNIGRTTDFAITFYLHDTILSDDQSEVLFTPSGLVSEEQIEQIKSEIELSVLSGYLSPNEEYSQDIICTGAQLQNEINKLPKFIRGQINIYLSDGIGPDGLSLNDFYGRGSITISPYLTAQLEISGPVTVIDCNLTSIRFEDLHVTGDSISFLIPRMRPKTPPFSLAGGIIVRDCHETDVQFFDCVIDPPATKENTFGFAIINSKATIMECTMHGRHCAIIGADRAKIALLSEGEPAPAQDCSQYCLMYGASSLAIDVDITTAALGTTEKVLYEASHVISQTA